MTTQHFFDIGLVPQPHAVENINVDTSSCNIVPDSTGYSYRALKSNVFRQNLFFSETPTKRGGEDLNLDFLEWMYQKNFLLVEYNYAYHPANTRTGGVSLTKSVSKGETCLMVVSGGSSAVMNWLDVPQNELSVVSNSFMGEDRECLSIPSQKVDFYPIIDSLQPVAGRGYVISANDVVDILVKEEPLHIWYFRFLNVNTNSLMTQQELASICA